MKNINKGQWRALIWFGSCIVLSLILVLSFTRPPALSDLFPLIIILFLTGGIGGGIFAGLKMSEAGKAFGKGILNFLLGILLVLMAYSVKHIISTGMIMDTILYQAAELISRSSPLIASFLMYGATFVMNFLSVPLAQRLSL
jgi:uncharacterized ion transporter superfamily protein YfcC